MSSSSNGNHSDNAPDSDYLDEVIAEYIRACELGQPPDRDELLAKHPDLADELREFFANRDQMDQVARPMRNLAARVLNVRCPHCHNPIELLDRAPLADISCPSCGSSFSLVGDKTEAHFPAGSKTIHHFELLEHVGIGAFGSVWKARDTKLDRTVAIKIPRRHQLNESETEMFLRDARAAAQLKHPNIVSVHEVGKQNGSIYIVSDFIQGVTLKEWMAAKPPTPREAAELCVKIAKALHHAHEAGVIHRDLKPSNIMIEVKSPERRDKSPEGVKGQKPSDKSLEEAESQGSRDKSQTDATAPSPALDSGLLSLDSPEPHIVDFGLAKREAGEITMTVEGQILGTPAYMSPEQARGEGHTVDRRADIYSLGVILFELLTGELPFRGDKQMLIVQIRNDDPPSPRKLNSSVPRDLETICLKCLEKEPSKRYRSVNQLSEDIQRWCNGQAIQARRSGRLERTVKWTRRKPAVAALVAVSCSAALLLIVGLAISNNLIGDALDDRTRALTELTETHVELSEQERNTRQALERERLALAEKTEALTERDNAFNDLKESLKRVRKHNYYHLIDLARRELEAGNPDIAEEFLNDCENSRLGWEWFYLNRLCGSPDAPRWRTLSETDGVRQWPHHTAAFSPDGSLVASIVSPRKGPTIKYCKVVVWNANTGKQELNLYGWWRKPYDVAFSNDGTLLAVSGGTRTRGEADAVTVWNVADKKLIHTLQHQEQVYRSFFHPDGGRISTAGREGAIIWSLDSGEQLKRFPSGSWTASAVFGSNGSRIVTCNAGGEVAVWDVDTGDKLRVLSIEKRSPSGASLQNYINAVVYSPDGKYLAAAHQSGQAMIWDAVTGEKLLTLKGHHHWIYNIAYSHDGKRIVTAGRDGSIKLWDAETFREILTLKSHAGRVFCAVFNPDDRSIVSTGDDGVIKMWNTSTFPVWEGNREHVWETNRTEDVAVPPTESTVSVPSVEPVAVPNEISRSDLLKEFSFARRVNSVAYSTNGKLLGTGSGGANEEGGITIRQLATRKEISLPQERGVTSVAFSPNGTLFAFGDFGSGVTIVDSSSGRLLHEFAGHTSAVTRVAFSPDGMQLATASVDGTIKIWDLANAHELLTLRGHSRMVYSVAYLGTSDSVISAGYDKSARIWDTTTGKVKHILEGHTESLSDAAFAPDGKSVVTASWDSSIRLWDPKSGEELSELKEHKSDVLTVTFSDDGQLIASGSEDGVVKIWDITRRHVIQTIIAHTGAVRCVRFAPDGKTLATASDDRTVRQWHLKKPESP